MESERPKQLYFKMFWTYTVIVLSIVLALVVYFVTVTKNRILETNQKEIIRIGTEALDYIEDTGQIADYIHKDLYRSPSEMADLLAYFQMEPEAYQQYSLDRYAASDDLAYKGIFNFIDENFEAYQRLEKIELISYGDFRMAECYGDKNVHPNKDGKARIEELESNSLGEIGKLTYLKEIRNPDTMEPSGCMIFTFEAQRELEKLCQSNEYAQMTVTAGNGEVVFQEPGDENWASLIQKEQYFVQKEMVDEYQIFTYMAQKKASQIPMARFLMILAVGAAASIIGIVCIEFYIKRLTRRVESILGAMKQVTGGDFKVRLKKGKKEDELDMIAENFNSMCVDLERYIEKSYLEEIERKNAQMQALQSQINPHFLYNTLEAIRMRAICNGDREVGKMLYSMVVLFRSQLKEADIITLGQELDYCKQYMELFEYRYQGSFQSRVDCPAEYLSIPIIKFVLQPIIENYFIHGIERERKDNLVRIWVERKMEKLYLHVEDNGRGMDKEEMERKNQELRENRKVAESKQSIGIHNVNRRIKAVYGEEYGISMEAAMPKGLKVTLVIKIQEGVEHEKGDVS